MAQLNSLLVTGNSRFLNPINGNARNGIYYVKGTQTAATGAWTGNIPIPALYDGLTIMYYLPYAGSGNATLNLTLSDGTTTGAKNCYYNTGRLTTHYGAGQNVVMTYHPAGSISVSGTATSDDRWVIAADYDQDYILPYTWTAGSTAVKYISGGYLYTNLTKEWFMFNLIYANTYAGALKLNVNGNGEKPLYINGTVSSSSNYTMPRGTYLTYYDGTNYYVRTDGKITASITGDAATVNGLTVQTAVPANAKFTDTTYPLSTKVIDANYKTAFRTETKGDTASGDYISTIRNDTANIDGSPQYGSGIASGRGDTHMYLYTRYSSEGFFVGGGNADKLNWVSQVYTTGYKPTKSDVGLGNVDNKSSATIRGELTSSNVTTALGYTPPTADTWRPISVKNYSLNDSEIIFKEGSNISLECSSTTPGVTNLSIGATNTTYTFANGTNGFTVTPSGGSAQTVTVTPSITNNVTGSGTSGYIAKFNGANTITNGPQLGSSTTTYLRNDGSWQTPPNDNNKVTQTETSSTGSYEMLLSGTADSTTRTEGANKSSKAVFNPAVSNGTSIGYQFKDGTRGDWTTDQTCGLLDITGFSTKNIRLCGDGTVAAENIICHSMYTYDISSQYTATKSSGNWSVVSVKAIRCGNVIQFVFRVKGNGSAVNAGTNAFVGTLSGGPLPIITTKLVTFISSTAVVCSISPESDYSSAAITVRVCYPNLTLASGSENEICGTFICP